MDKMYELDIRDKKIIIALDIDARQSNTSIARTTKIPLYVVNYKIEKLIQNNVIKKFTTFIPLGKFGSFVYKIYFQLTGLPAEKEKIMLRDFVSDSRIDWIAKTEGRWDLMIAIYAKDCVEFGRIKEDIFFKYGHYFQDYDITMIKEAHPYPRDYLLTDSRTNVPVVQYIGGNTKVQITNTDKKLLKLLVENCRYSALELSQKLNINIKTVISRIKELKKSGVIQKFTILFNINEVGYKYYKLCIYLKNVDEKIYNRIISYCKHHSNVIHLIECIGSWELEIETEVTSDHEISKMNRDIRNIFTDYIKRIESVSIFEEMKLQLGPRL